MSLVRSIVRSPIRSVIWNALGDNASDGAAASFDYWVDSVSGSDSNAGTSLLLAKQTLAGLTLTTDKRYAFVKGSTWKEQLAQITVPITIGIDGTGNVPVIDGASPVSGTWTQPDSVTYPNVWSISVTRDNAAPASTELLSYWEDGVRPRYATNTTTDLQNNGGWRATSRTTQTTTIYIKSTADPNSDGIVREFSKRDHGLKGHTATLPGAAPTSTIVGPLEIKRCVGHYNAVSGGPGIQKQLLVRDGSIHHMVSEAEDVQDVIATEFQTGFGQAQVPLAAYRAVGTGFNPVWKRLMVFGPGAAVGDGVTGILSHGSSSFPDSFTMEQGAFKDVSAGVSTDTTAYENRGSYFYNTKEATTIQAATSTLRYAMFREPQGSTNGQIIDIGPGTGVSKVRTIEHCVIYASSLAAAACSFRVNNKFGSIIIRNCIIVLNASAGDAIFLTAAAGGGTLDITFEYNVICKTFTSSVHNTLVLTGSPNVTSDHNLWIGGNNIECSLNGTNYRSLANWQALGYDANSKHLSISANYATLKSTYFQGNPEDGDFRLKAGIGTFTDGVSLNLAGPQYHWDWNARAVASGAPTAWPILPTSLAEYRTYINDPTAWTF